MDAFEFLGISSTKDLKEIRKAYSRLLTKVSPEKDPEGFQQLRAAYEEAVAKAKSMEDTVLSPVDEFMNKFEGNYKCFRRRIDINSWQQLLDMDICYSIDSSKDVSYRILTFIMSNYNFPSSVWRLFNEHFSWSGKKEILYNDYPRNFIDFVIYKINNESTFNYEYLVNCEQDKQDIFIEEFRKVDSALENYDLYAAEVSIKAAKEICARHPGLLILIGKYYVSCAQISKAEELFNGIIDEDEENFDAIFNRGELYFALGKLEEAYRDYRNAINIKADLPYMWYSMAKCCICIKKYEEAIVYSEKLIDVSPYRTDIRSILNSSYNYYIDNLLGALREDPENSEIKYKLAKTYLKISKVEESYNIVSELMQSTKPTSDLYKMYCQVLVGKNELQLAYNNICKAVELFNHDYNLNFLKADILDDLGRYEEAVEQYNKVIEIDNRQSTAFNNKAFVLNKLNRYNEALEAINTAIILDSKSAHSYKNKANALFGLELYEDCLEACEDAISRYVYLTEAYIIKMKTLIKINLIHEALGVYNKANELGLKDSRLYCEKAKALMYIEKYNESIDYSDYALELDENYADAFYIKGCCHYWMEHFNEAIKYFDSAIGIFKEMVVPTENYTAAYFYKIKSLFYISNTDEAIKVINQAINLGLPNLDRFHNLLGEIMVSLNRYEAAFNEYDKAIKYNPNVASYYYSAGHALSELSKFDEAIDFTKKYVELEPDAREGYVNISYSLYKSRNYEECIKYCNKAIEIDAEYDIAHQNKGWSLYQLKRIEEAEKECNIALKLNGSSEDILLLKLRILEYKGLYKEALMVCERMLEINENNREAKHSREELMNKLNKKDGLFKKILGR